MRSQLTAVAVVVLCAPLASCGTGAPSAAGASSSATSSATSAASSSAAASTAAAVQFSSVDVTTCQTFVAKAGPAYVWLTTLERDGSISGSLATPGYLEVYNLGGTASVFASQVDSLDLRTAMQDVERDGQALRAAIDAQTSVKATPLREDLDRAADACKAGGFVIDWRHG